MTTTRLRTRTEADDMSIKLVYEEAVTIKETKIRNVLSSKRNLLCLRLPLADSDEVFCNKSAFLLRACCKNLHLDETFLYHLDSVKLFFASYLRS